MRQAIQTHYLVDPIQQQNFHSALAAYFLQREPNIRTLDELPWQLAKAGDWYQLTNVLSTPSFFTRSGKKMNTMPKCFGRKLRSGQAPGWWKPTKWFESQPENYLHYLRPLASLLLAGGHTQEALNLQEARLKKF